MGNLIGILIAVIAAGFGIWVIFKIIQAGIDDRKADDKEQKEYLDNHSEDLPSPKKPHER